VQLKEVFIYKFEDGIYSSELTFTDGERTIGLDARTSDAIAIAMRAGAPIYTTQAIVDETGIELEEVEIDTDALHPEETPADEAVSTESEKAEDMSTGELEKRLAQLIEEENYEEAARVSAIIKQRKQP
jgi:bifunctional DNase/RNase